MGALPCGDEHGGQQCGAPGKDQAIDGNYDCRSLEVLELWVLNLAIHLGQAFFAAHGQDRVAEGHENPEQTKHRHQPSSLEEAQRIGAELEMRWRGRRRQMDTAHHHRENSPQQEDDHHHRGNLHDPQCLAAGLLDALDVLPPVIDGHRSREDRRGVIHIKLEGAVLRGHQSWRKPVAIIGDHHHFIHQSCNILSGGHTGDRSGKNVVEHEGGYADLGKGAAQGLLHHAVNAAAGKHRTALDVDRANRKTEQHDAEDEPWRGCAHRFFSDAAGIKGG